MTKHSSFLKFALLGLVCLAASPALAESPVATTTFNCAKHTSIAATFYAHKVDLKLSDGRSMTLPQVVSGSGARYANSDESFVFWNKGNMVTVTESPDPKAAAICIAAN